LDATEMPQAGISDIRCLLE